MNGSITNRHGELHWKVRGGIGVVKRERENKKRLMKREGRDYKEEVGGAKVWGGQTPAVAARANERLPILK